MLPNYPSTLHSTALDEFKLAIEDDYTQLIQERTWFSSFCLYWSEILLSILLQV